DKGTEPSWVRQQLDAHNQRDTVAAPAAERVWQRGDYSHLAQRSVRDRRQLECTGSEYLAQRRKQRTDGVLGKCRRQSVRTTNGECADGADHRGEWMLTSVEKYVVRLSGGEDVASVHPAQSAKLEPRLTPGRRNSSGPPAGLARHPSYFPAQKSPLKSF